MRSGQYITQLEENLKYKAFVANPLPFELKKDPGLETLLSEANLALGRLDGVSEIVPDVDFLTLMYGRKEATYSSQVEGTQATFTDVLKAEAKIKDKTIPPDVKEILNYIKAMNYGMERLKTLPLSLRLIREIHKILLTGVRGKERIPGEFKKSQNWVGGPTIETATFVPCPPHEVMNLLDNLEKFLCDKLPIPILIKIGLIHSQFESVHPFLDGNGRVGRLLITFYLYHQKILQNPLLYLSAYFKKNQKEYYYRLNGVHEKDSIEDWLKFFLKGVRDTAQEGFITAQKILRLKENDTKKVSILGRSTKNALKVLNNLYRTPIISLNHIIEFTGLSKSNAYYLLKKLENLKILHYLPKESPKTKVFIYKDYLGLFE
ncbi:Fic family protein [candidate division WOR-3 bacterium]|nr:Fic family protein [candidate division WOR-3 bacterium]